MKAKAPTPPYPKFRIKYPYPQEVKSFLNSAVFKRWSAGDKEWFKHLLTLEGDEALTENELWLLNKLKPFMENQSAGGQPGRETTAKKKFKKLVEAGKIDLNKGYKPNSAVLEKHQISPSSFKRYKKNA